MSEHGKTVFSGKTAVVTGGSRGIGRAICIRLAASGAQVICCYSGNESAAKDTLRYMGIHAGDGYYGEIAQVDIKDLTSIKKLEKEIALPVDILINCAGVTSDGLMARMKESSWDEVIDTNLKGAFLCSQTFVKKMMKNRWGRIINVSSVIGHIGNAGQVNYAASKSGLFGLTKSMAKEFASRNITVNCVAPGFIETDMTTGLKDGVKEVALSHIPLGKFGKPRDVAEAVAWIASPYSGYITGQIINVDGGMVMS